MDESFYPNGQPWQPQPAGRRHIRTRSPKKVYISREVLRLTSDFMIRHGTEQRECYVWWGGSHTSDDLAYVTTAYFPVVPSNRGRVEISREMSSKLLEAMRANDQVLVVELHTHPPGAGCQSHVDADNAAAPYDGFFSLVVPDFAAPYFFDLRKVHVHECQAGGDWKELDPREIEDRFAVEPNAVVVEEL